ncbi:MAG: class II fructose-bisphosphatase [Reichenbachiella sp.]
MDEHIKIKNILVNVVAKAAVATQPFIGSEDKEGGDQAAVDAMRKAFVGQELNAVVRVGEGEKDEAPMLYVGEELGSGKGLAIDIAVDPVEGTALMARGDDNAIAVIAASDRGSFWDAGSAYYMDKIVVGLGARGCIDINKSTKDNLTAIAKGLNKKVSELTVFVLDKPRHHELVQDIKAAGASVDLHAEGDVIGSILAVMPDSGIDVLMGIGGAPEAVISAAAVKMMGGDMQGKLAPQKAEEELGLLGEGADLDKVLTTDDLVKSDWAIFSAAGVTDGVILKGVHGDQGSLSTECLTIGPQFGKLERKILEG